MPLLLSKLTNFLQQNISVSLHNANSCEVVIRRRKGEGEGLSPADVILPLITVRKCAIHRWIPRRLPLCSRVWAAALDKPSTAGLTSHNCEVTSSTFPLPITFLMRFPPSLSLSLLHFQLSLFALIPLTPRHPSYPFPSLLCFAPALPCGDSCFLTRREETY